MLGPYGWFTMTTLPLTKNYQENQMINKKLDDISKLQNRALRIINFKNYQDESNPLYSSNKILKINDFITLQNVLLVHDYLKDTLPECFQDYFHKLQSSPHKI